MMNKRLPIKIFDCVQNCSCHVLDDMDTCIFTGYVKPLFL